MLNVNWLFHFLKWYFVSFCKKNIPCLSWMRLRFLHKKIIVLWSGKTDPFTKPFMHITIRTNIRHLFFQCYFITKLYGLNENNNIDTKYCTIISYFNNNVILLKPFFILLNLSFSYFGLFYNFSFLYDRLSEMNDCLMHKLPSF